MKDMIFWGFVLICFFIFAIWKHIVEEIEAKKSREKIQEKDDEATKKSHTEGDGI
jgi:large-conductance mechanosensitive channel